VWGEIIAKSTLYTNRVEGARNNLKSFLYKGYNPYKLLIKFPLIANKTDELFH
jgi:hypothetical protein